ncbi:hypothetical protein HK105_208640 [Polyrhizophydium stewartii]|uniref:Uncharacterized protein n=1 Tax=Polyrhizophydium stewartii TaxID=2732419 RepID=A0ABR4MX90_9FUNG
MIDHPSPHTFSRLKSDITELESLASLICELCIPLDGVICEAMERLVELAGSNDFLPAFAALQISILKTKWAREDHFGAGYILPWVQVYSCLGHGTKLGAIASGCVAHATAAAAAAASATAATTAQAGAAAPAAEHVSQHAAVSAESSASAHPESAAAHVRLSSEARVDAASAAGSFGSGGLPRCGASLNGNPVPARADPHPAGTTGTAGLFGSFANLQSHAHNSAINPFGNGFFPAEVNMSEIINLGLFRTKPQAWTASHTLHSFTPMTPQASFCGQQQAPAVASASRPPVNLQDSSTAAPLTADPGHSANAPTLVPFADRLAMHHFGLASPFALAHGAGQIAAHLNGPMSVPEDAPEDRTHTPATVWSSLGASALLPAEAQPAGFPHDSRLDSAMDLDLQSLTSRQACVIDQQTRNPSQQQAEQPSPLASAHPANTSVFPCQPFVQQSVPLPAAFAMPPAAMCHTPGTTASPAAASACEASPAYATPMQPPASAPTLPGQPVPKKRQRGPRPLKIRANVKSALAMSPAAVPSVLLTPISPQAFAMPAPALATPLVSPAAEPPSALASAVPAMAAQIQLLPAPKQVRKGRPPKAAKLQQQQLQQLQQQQQALTQHPGGAMPGETLAQAMLVPGNPDPAITEGLPPPAPKRSKPRAPRPKAGACKPVSATRINSSEDEKVAQSIKAMVEPVVSRVLSGGKRKARAPKDAPVGAPAKKRLSKTLHSQSLLAALVGSHLPSTGVTVAGFHLLRPAPANASIVRASSFDYRSLPSASAAVPIGSGGMSAAAAEPDTLAAAIEHMPPHAAAAAGPAVAAICLQEPLLVPAASPPPSSLSSSLSSASSPTPSSTDAAIHLSPAAPASGGDGVMA